MKRIETRVCPTCDQTFEVRHHSQHYCRPEHRPPQQRDPDAEREYNRSLMQRGRGAIKQPDHYAEFYDALVETEQRLVNGDPWVSDHLAYENDEEEQAMLDEIRRTGMLQAHGPETALADEYRILIGLHRLDAQEERNRQRKLAKAKALLAEVEAEQAILSVSIPDEQEEQHE